MGVDPGACGISAVSAFRSTTKSLTHISSQGHGAAAAPRLALSTRSESGIHINITMDRCREAGFPCNLSAGVCDDSGIPWPRWRVYRGRRKRVADTVWERTAEIDMEWGATTMSSSRRPAAFWFNILFLAVSVVLMLAGQTLGVFDYDLAVSMGLQEKPEEMTEFGVQVNRAFGVSDTVVYVPLIVASLVGLWLRKRWSLLTTAAFCGASAYWTVTVTFIFIFAPGVPGYSNIPGPEIWLFIGTYMVVGVVGLCYLIWRGDELLQ